MRSPGKRHQISAHDFVTHWWTRTMWFSDKISIETFFVDNTCAISLSPMWSSATVYIIILLQNSRFNVKSTRDVKFFSTESDFSQPVSRRNSFASSKTNNRRRSLRYSKAALIRHCPLFSPAICYLLRTRHVRKRRNRDLFKEHRNTRVAKQRMSRVSRDDREFA